MSAVDQDATTKLDDRTSHERYVEMTQRLSRFHALIGVLITPVLVGALWGNWNQLGIVLSLNLIGVPFNAWVGLWLLPRIGRPAEVLRSVVNLCVVLGACHFAQWVLPVWIAAPFIALALDHFDRRIALWVPLTFCLAQDALAIWDGVPLIYPAVFTLFTFFCQRNTFLRYDAILKMVSRGDRQRANMEQAHASLRDVHERLRAETAARQQSELDLQQAQKLESVGRLAAGVAHEINTPVQFVSDSLHFMRDASNDLMQVISTLQAVRQHAERDPSNATLADETRHAEEAADLPYIQENVPKAVTRSLDGLTRVATIVRSMKEFAHPDSREMTHADLNRAIESTLIIASHEYKYVAELETKLGDLPPVVCHVGEINQVILSIVMNAAHAIGTVVKNTTDKGRITVTTRRFGDDVEIAISDTGNGMPESVRQRIFDPLSTAESGGKGIGQGLAVARSVIVQKHKGSIDVSSAPGKGTTFIIRLPIAPIALGVSGAEEAA